MSEIKKLPKAKYSAELDLNGFMLSCAVLDDGTRVFSERSLANAFGIRGGGAFWKRKKETKNDSTALPEYLSSKTLKPFISKEVLEKFGSTVLYESVSGIESNGIEGTALADICDVFVQAKNAGINNENILVAADNAYKMIKGFAKVGIIALIDEATGYQYDREKKELQAILKALVSDEILDYQKQFQLSFYKEIFRLWEIPFTAQNIKNKQQFIGHITNKFIYSNLPKGTIVLENLKERTPKTNGGNWKYKLHQSLTKDMGREALKKVLYSVEAIASVSKDKKDFERLMNEKYGQKEIPFPDMDQLYVNEKPKIELSDFNKNLETALNYNPKKD